MFRPGELDQKIAFKRPCRESDGMGGYTVLYDDIDTHVWAKVRPLSGKEVDRFDKLNAEELTLFVTRKRVDINEGDFIVFDGIDFNIRRIPSFRSVWSKFSGLISISFAYRSSCSIG